MYTVLIDGIFFFGSGNKARPGFNVIDPILRMGVNAIDSFEFTVYPEHPYFNKIKELMSYAEIRKGEKTVFKGRALSIQSGFYNEKRITFEGCLGYLSDSVIRPYDFMSGDNHTTPDELFQFFIGQHNSQVDKTKQFKVGRITVSDPNNYIARSESDYLNTWESIREKLLETSLGGVIGIRYEEDGNYIDYLSSNERQCSQSIEFGKNLVDFSRTENSDEIATVMIPLGGKTEEGEKITIAPLTDYKTDDICKTGDYIYSKKGIEKYGYIVKAVNFEDIIGVIELMRSAKNYLINSLDTMKTIELTATDLSAVNSDIEEFSVGQRVKIKSEPHKLEAEFEVTLLEINLMSPGSNRIVLGTQQDSIVSQRADGSILVSGYGGAGSVSCKAGTGLVLSGDTINHSNSIAAGNAGGVTGCELKVPVIGYDSEGHLLSVRTDTVKIEFSHTQSEPSKVWVIIHDMGKNPAVNVIDSEGETVLCDVEYSGANSVTLRFSEATAGTAYLN